MFSKSTFSFLFLLVVSFSAVAVDKIRIAGSTTVLPIVSEAAKQFRAMNPGLSLTVSGGGSGVGVSSVGQGKIELGMASRSLTEGEKQRLGSKVREVPIARDAIAVAISKAVYEGGVTRLSIQQIADIYRGRITNWQQVGGPDSKILVIDKESSRGTRHVFAKVILGSERARAPGASIITGSNNEEQAAIANSNKAIGMLSNAWLNDKVRAVAVGEKGQAVLPILTHIADGSYPIQRTLNILVPHESDRTVMAFVDYLLSEQGQRVVQEVGYLPVN